MKNSGFTLVEIMVVVAILIVLVSLSIPNLLRARLTVNEYSAMATLRSLSACAESYRAAQTQPKYPENLANLTNVTPPYISGFTGGNEKTGYKFFVAGSENKYQAVANPIDRGTTGDRSFCVDHSGVLMSRYTDYTAVVGDCAGNIIE